MPTILDLLMALNRGDLPPLPDPAKPVGMPLPVNAPPVTTMPAGPPPDLPPTAPLPPLDLNLIKQIAGPAPTAPAPLSRGQRIANALMGFGAGLQGNGAQFLAQLQEPQREYQRQLERYEGKRAQGVELATRQQERGQERAQRQAEQAADREFNVWLRKANITDEQAALQARQAFDLQKLREQERIADEKLERQQKAAKEKQRNDIVSKLVGQDFAPTKFANEIADAIVFGKPLSPAAEKWRSVKAQKLEAQLARIGGGGGGSAGPVMAQLQNGQVVPLSAVDKQSGGVMLNGDLVPVVGYVGGRIPAKPQQQPQSTAAPAPMFSFENMLQTPSYMSQGAPEFSRAEVIKYARQQKRKPADIEAEIKARGGVVK